MSVNSVRSWGASRWHLWRPRRSRRNRPSKPWCCRNRPLRRKWRPPKLQWRRWLRHPGQCLRRPLLCLPRRPWRNRPNSTKTTPKCAGSSWRRRARWCIPVCKPWRRWLRTRGIWARAPRCGVRSTHSRAVRAWSDSPSSARPPGPWSNWPTPGWPNRNRPKATCCRWPARRCSSSGSGLKTSPAVRIPLGRPRLSARPRTPCG